MAFLPQQHLVPGRDKSARIDRLRAFAFTLNLWGKLSQKKMKNWSLWAMAQTQTAELAEQLVSDLSGGQQQRVFLAMTLAQDAELVLLDEPTTYLDLNRQAELMGMMRQMQQNGKTVITVLHDLNQVCRYCGSLNRHEKRCRNGTRHT